jgi:hypothetical protein
VQGVGVGGRVQGVGSIVSDDRGCFHCGSSVELVPRVAIKHEATSGRPHPIHSGSTLRVYTPGILYTIHDTPRVQTWYTQTSTKRTLPACLLLSADTA